jgi:hypothetical protein
MSFFQWLSDLFRHDAQQRTRIPVIAANDLTGQSGIAAVADHHYVRLWLSEIFLQRDRDWFTGRFPLGYSLIAHQYGDQPKVEFTNVAGKNKFDIAQFSQDKSILRNYAMTPLVPFRGGSIEVDCGLVSMESSNLLESFAKTVGDIASKLNVPQASSVISIASSVALGVQELFGASKAATVLYAHDMFTGKTLTSGYTLLASETLASFKNVTVWMTEAGIRVGPDKGQLMALPPQDFLVVFVECTQERDDWQSLKAIAKPLDDAVAAKLAGRDDEAKVLLIQSKTAALTSPDLTRLDAKRVIKAIDIYFADSDAIKDTAKTAAVDRGGAVDAKEPARDTSGLHLARAVALVTPNEAAAFPDATYATILGATA